MTPMRRVSEEVYVTDEAVTAVGAEELSLLKREAQGTARKRIRLCAHHEVSAAVHEMIIVHTGDAYVRPHKHMRKSESFHVIEGAADVLVFSEDGRVRAVVRIGASGSGVAWYCRLAHSNYHTLLITSPWFVFHETTGGPFDKADTIYAPWAPPLEEAVAGRRFLEQQRDAFYSSSAAAHGRRSS